MRHYLDPGDHAFAHGPVFTRPESVAAAERLLDTREQAERLCAVFDTFHERAEVGEGLRLGLHARLVAPKGERRVRIGSDCVIRGLVRCDGPATVEIGDLVYLGDGVIVSAETGIRIGSETMLAHGAHVFDNDTHPVDAGERAEHFRSILCLTPRRDFAIGRAPVSIGSRCWIGFNAAVMKGVTIGDDSIAAAGAVVVGDAPPGSILAGNPARLVKSISSTAGERAGQGPGRRKGWRAFLSRLASDG